MNPTQLAEQVRENISRLDDQALLRVLDAPEGEYTPEALAFAGAEIERRGGRGRVADGFADDSAEVPLTGGTDSRLEQGVDIGGWLLLPGIGLAVAVATTIFGALPLATRFLSSPGIETGLDLIFLSPWVQFVMVVGWLFVTKHRWAPFAYIALQIANLVIVVRYYGPMAAADEEAASMSLTRALVSCVVWIPYFLTSKRVKSTFVR